MPELFTKFGGHRQAAGVTLAVANVWKNFARGFARYAAALLTAADFEATIEIDAEIEFRRDQRSDRWRKC